MSREKAHDLKSPRFAGDPVHEACYDNERLLRVGDRGPAVVKIQQALIDAGFPLPKFGADGIFGAETKAAVRNYQRAHGLSVDGSVGPITMGESGRAICFYANHTSPTHSHWSEDHHVGFGSGRDDRLQQAGAVQDQSEQNRTLWLVAPLHYFPFRCQEEVARVRTQKDVAAREQ